MLESGGGPRVEKSAFKAGFWSSSLEALTGQREMDATAILDYFAPLKSWLDEQNAGRSCGW